MTKTKFLQLNHGWNAEPNAPVPQVSVDGSDLQVSFYLNAFRFRTFAEGDQAVLRFKNCQRYRLGGTNDEGWYKGECRFSHEAPAWGQFYAVSGESDHLLRPTDWVMLAAPDGHEPATHYLFYFRDETFECLASEWGVQLLRP